MSEVENQDQNAVEEVEEEEPCTLDITDDMYVGNLSEDIIDSFVCMLCYGIVQNPLKCNTCQNLVCKTCVPLDTISKNKFSCFKKCGGFTFSESLYKTEK